MTNPYETRKLVSEYLFFHYAEEADFPDAIPVPRGALHFPVRLVTELADHARGTRTALDLGCAVGRSTFELARFAQSVIGVDYSAAFIRAAETLRCDGRHPCQILVEGERTAEFTARVPEGIDVSRVSFETGDASALRPDIGCFDLVLAANLLCRLPDPGKFLGCLSDLVAPGGQLLLTTPFSWLPEFTDPGNWIGGHPGTGTSWDALRGALEPHFDLQLKKEMPFLIREHSRKYQYGVSLGSRWIRRS